MDEKQSKFLQTRTDDITTAIMNNIDWMRAKMISYGLADDMMIEKIMTERGSNIQGQAVGLHTLVMRQGSNDTFENYYRCLIEIGANKEIIEAMQELLPKDQVDLNAMHTVAQFQ